MYLKALNIAKKAHENQLDKGGLPYIQHPITISDKMKNIDEKIVALLHDVLEDSSITINDLKNEGFCQYILDAIIAITRLPDEPYNHYLNRVKQNDLARIVKIEDLKHNCDLNRIKKPTEKDYNRVKKYEKSLKKLMKMI